MTVTPQSFQTLSKLMGAAELRHRVISNNVANVNTPGFRQLDVSFEDKLAQVIADPGKSDVGKLEPEIFEVPGLPERVDGNNVDVDKQMGLLSKNALLYNTYAQVLASQISMMREAITSG